MPPLSKVFQSTWQHTYEVLISKNIGAEADKRLKFCPRFTLHFSFHPPQPFSLFFAHLFTSAVVDCSISPSSSYHPLWVGRIFHTAFGLRSVKHLGQRTKYRTGTERQTTSRSNLLPSNFDSRGGCVGYSLCNTLWGPKLVPCTVESTRLPLHDSLLTVRQTDIQSLVWMITLLLTMTLSFMCSWCERIHALFYGEKSQTNLLFQCH